MEYEIGDEDSTSELIFSDEGTISEENADYMRRMARSDFFYFARTILGYETSLMEWREKPADPELAKDFSKWKRVQVERSGPEYGISELGPHKEMVKLLLDGNPRKHLEAPRMSYKTTILIAWVLWHLLFVNRNARILYLMDTLTEAKKKSKAMRQHIEREDGWLRKLFPDFQIESLGDKGSFTITGRTKVIVDPTVECGGVDVDMTGSHRDIIIMDDPVNFLNIRTKEGIEKTRAYFDMAQPLLDPGGIFVAVGTRYNDADLWGDILREMSTEVGGDWSCLVLDCGMELVLDRNKNRKLVGKPKFAHLTKEVLESIMWSMETTRFLSQFMNKCMAAGSQIFHRHQFAFETFDPGWMGSLRYHVLTDTATTANEDGCFSVVALVGLDSLSNAYLVDLRVGRWSPNDVVHAICDVCQLWVGRGLHISQVCMEKVTLNKTFKVMLENEMRHRDFRVKITDIARGATEPSKRQRIQGLSMRFEQKRFFVCDTVPRWFQDGHRPRILYDPSGFKEQDGSRLPAGELVDQFIRFPVGSFVDIPDALADIEALDSQGHRVCMGAGKKEPLKNIMARRTGQIAGPGSAVARRGVSNGSKWDALASRVGRAL